MRSRAGWRYGWSSATARRWAWATGALLCPAWPCFSATFIPVYFRFKGGKGVATAAGVILAFNPWLALATGVTWLIIAFFFRYSSLAALVAAVFAAFYSALGWGFDERFIALVVIAGFVIYRHQANIRNLMAGKERRFGEKSKDALPRV